VAYAPCLARPHVADTYWGTIILGMTTSALLIIDAQVNMFEPQPVDRAPEVLEQLKQLLARARAAGAPVVFVRNNGGPDDPDYPHSPGWAIHPALAPAEGESIIDKFTPDAFHQTNLAGNLAGRGVGHLVVAGMQTEFCIDTTVRRAFSLGYRVTLAADAHSTYAGRLPAADITAHHNAVLAAFATVCPSAEIVFDALPRLELAVDGLALNDLSGIASGLEEWPEYDTWMAGNQGHPFWPHSHPGRVADALNQLKDPTIRVRGHYAEPPRWEMGLARAFYQPLENIPMAFRAAAVASVSKAIDHLLQSPRNPLSPHMRPVLELDQRNGAPVQPGEKLWLYDARDLRLFYVPSITTDRTGAERRYVFLLWLAPGVPVRNPFLA